MLTVWTQLCSCGMTRLTTLLTVLLQVDDIIATADDYISQCKAHLAIYLTMMILPIFWPLKQQSKAQRLLDRTINSVHTIVIGGAQIRNKIP